MPSESKKEARKKQQDNFYKTVVKLNKRRAESRKVNLDPWKRR